MTRLVAPQSDPATARCPNCGAIALLSFTTTDRNRHLSSEAFVYFRCNACTYVFLEPIPSDLGRYYPKSYYGIPSSIEQLARMAKSDRYKLEIVRQFVPSGKMLEIGPAYGAFAYLAKEAGYEVHCLEFDIDCCRFLNDIVGVTAVQTTDPARDLAERDATYDVICLWQNIEHLPNAREAFANAARRLRPGGAIVVATPNPDSMQFRILGSCWTHVDAPRHVALIPIPVIEPWASTNELRSRLVTTTDRGSRGWDRFGWTQSFANFAASRLPRIALRLLGIGLTLLLIPIERTGRRGSCYTAVFGRDLT
jgi:SAM-dependent methyltransferase